MIKKQNLNEFLSKLKNKKVLIITAILGILLMIMPFSEAEKKESYENYPKESPKLIDEKKLKSILESIEGAGKVKVFISYDGDAEQIPATDYKREVSQNGERVEVTVKNADNTPYIVKELAPKVSGVLVTATGADTLNMKIRIMKSVKAATGIPLNKICVEKGE